MTSIYDLIALGFSASTFVITLVLLVVVLRMWRPLDDLHKWHSREDDDGTKLMYFPRSIEKAIEGLSVSIDKQREAIEKQTEFLMYIRGVRHGEDRTP